jgi:ureidoglycolate lyase
MNSPSKPGLIDVAVQTATPRALAAYGTLLGYDAAVQPLPIDFYDGAVQVRRVAQFQAQGQVEMPITTVLRRPLTVRWMERHPLHTQAFIPLGGKPFIACFAPPNTDELPDIHAIEAFLFDGSAGFLMHTNVWHDFPFALVDNTQLLIVLTQQATDGLTRDNVVQDEADGPDIQKRDLLKRLNLHIQLTL